MTITMEEAIERLKQLKAAAEFYVQWVGNAKSIDNNTLKDIEAFNTAIEALSIDRSQGEWIDVNGDGSLWRCSRCKDTACCDGNYCPTCGAKMG